MITIQIGGEDLVIRPLRLHDYIDKVDFIKMRRVKPWDLIQGFPEEMTEENYAKLVTIAMETVYRGSSSVSRQEELDFDSSDEGLMYSIWKSLPPLMKKTKGPKIASKPVPETWKEGLQRAKALWAEATREEKEQLIAALRAADQRNAIKNSDGPPPTQEEGSSSEPPSP